MLIKGLRAKRGSCFFCFRNKEVSVVPVPDLPCTACPEIAPHSILSHLGNGQGLTKCKNCHYHMSRWDEEKIIRDWIKNEIELKKRGIVL